MNTDEDVVVEILSEDIRSLTLTTVSILTMIQHSSQVGHLSIFHESLVNQLMAVNVTLSAAPQPGDPHECR